MTDLSADEFSREDGSILYASEDAQAILQIAIARHTEEGELTRSQLLDIATELGISATTLDEAEQEWRIRKVKNADQSAFNQFRKQRFQSHLIRYLVVNVFLMAINYLATGGFSWSLYILLFWGVAIALQAWQTFYPNEYRYSQEFEKWRRR
ncbi:MAG: 2TM domain-containing protein, partial [Leptolyngbyaceae cyanobacterium T60_A2020_046]|nr:2TM domain-containing protein [Leptolyngbyaceae cyanobacterium T60_A2020_046]